MMHYLDTPSRTGAGTTGASDMLTFDIDNLLAQAPLYCVRPNESKPDPAYVELDEAGRVTADYRPAGAWSNGEATRRTLSWPVSPASSGPALAAALRSQPIRGLLERVHAGRAIEWTGTEYRGQLTDDAQDASDALWQALDRLDIDAEIWPAADYLSADGRNRLQDVWPAGTSLDDAVAALEASARSDGLILDGSVRAELIDWAARLLRRDDLGLVREHLDALVALGEADAAQAGAYDPA